MSSQYPLNTIQCGDNLTLLKQIPSSTIDLIITSPPYYQQRDYDGLGAGNEHNIANYIEGLLEVFEECVRVIKNTGSIVYNIGDKYLKSNLSLIPYRFAIAASCISHVSLINNITWVKNNPTPRQYSKRLVSSTEPFFHFVKSTDYYYNKNQFLSKDTGKNSGTSNHSKVGNKYIELIDTSNLTSDQKENAYKELRKVINEVQQQKIESFRMKIKGIHALPFGGQEGGRKTQIEQNGFTIIKIKGEPLKKDVIESPVETIKGVKHPAIFPEKVICEFVSLLTDENHVVLDPYVGSGTTAVVAKKMKRLYIGFDINPMYCNYANERLANVV